MAYRIKALRNSCLDFPVPGLAMYFRDKVDRTVEVCGYVWLIRGEGRIVVVDAGMGDEQPQEIQKCGSATIFPGEDTASLLKREGIDPGEVDCLVLSHLHRDHIRNVPLFTSAQIVISAAGWESIARPAHPAMIPDPIFPQSVFSYLERECWGRIVLANPEQQIAPGIEVFYTGGHTPCSQATVVETTAGRAVLCGDVVFLYGNIEENIPVAYCTNLLECYQAMDRIRETADIVLPNHDPEVLKRHPGGIIG